MKDIYSADAVIAWLSSDGQHPVESFDMLEDVFQALNDHLEAIYDWILAWGPSVDHYVLRDWVEME